MRFEHFGCGVDLNRLCALSSGLPGVHINVWQDAVRSAYGLSALEHLHAPGGALQWRPPRADAHVRGTISRHGIRPTDFSGEFARDIETCLSAQSSKLYHMGFRNPVRRSTLADANETRDWRIYAEFAQRLIGQARRLYAGDSLGVDLDNTVHALDSTTIDLCLSVFPWAHFRNTKAAAEMLRAPVRAA